MSSTTVMKWCGECGSVSLHEIQDSKSECQECFLKSKSRLTFASKCTTCGGISERGKTTCPDCAIWLKGRGGGGKQ